MEMESHLANSFTNLKVSFNFIKITFSMKFIIITTLALLYSSFSKTQPLLPFSQNELWGYLDTTGKIVIEPQYPMAGFFQEGLAYVQIEDALGYINTKGEVIIEPEYPAATNFLNGFASVMIDEDWMVINKNGELIMESYFERPMIFKDGLAKFKLEMGLRSKYGFINIYGDTAIYPKYEMASDFSEGLCMATPDGRKYGYINTKGEWIIPAEYDLGVLMKINGDYDFSDKNFSDGYVSVQKGEKYGIIDKTGKLVLDFTFDFIGEFSEGLAPAKKDDKYGYIDINGKWVIKPEYTSAEKFHNGLAAVSLGPLFEEKYGFINSKGKIVIPITIESYYSMSEAMKFWEGFVPCFVEYGVFGYIDRKGEVIWKMGE